MSETSRLIVSLSLSGSILAAIIFVMKPLVRHKLSKTIQYYIWVFVLLRLVFPFSFEESMMNRLFSGEPTSITVSLPEETATRNISLPLNAQEAEHHATYNNHDGHSTYPVGAHRQYLLYIWLLGASIALVINLGGYIRFLRHLKRANKPATIEEHNMLEAFIGGQSKVKLLRNRLATTPMLIGVIRPCIIIPDIDFDQKQLKNILLHEIAHLRRYDIAIKWLTMIVTSIHWFNPFMYFIKREINRACELSCDETVIRKFNRAEKQSYGDTLISVVSNNQYPAGVLQATMSEEKETIKERLLSIMKYNKKSKLRVFLSVILLVGVVSIAALLGACNGKTDEEVVYKSDTYGFSITLPKDFSESVDINQQGNVLYFMSKEIRKIYPDAIMGVVGRIEIHDKKETTKANLKALEDAYGLRYLGENEKYYFGWAHATDVQIPLDSSESFNESFRNMEKEFDEVIDTFQIHNPSGQGSSNQDPSNESQKSTEFFVKGKGGVVSLGDWDNEVDIAGALGEKVSEKTEKLGAGADTFTGMFVKMIESEGAKLTLFSPSDNGETFWIQSISFTGEGYETLKGIKVGDSLDSTKSKLGEGLLAINTGNGAQIYSYSVGLDVIVFEFLEDILKKVEVKREMP